MILLAAVFTGLVTSCENQEVEFPDFDYSTVYFAYQYPVRTIVLGDDIFDNTLDNAHKFKIFATMGGVYANDKNVNIDVVVDESLVDNLVFGDGSPVQAMPTSYYELASDQITLKKEINGGVEVQLSDAFFADLNALKNTYVVPLRMTHVENADSILSGMPNGSVPSPVRSNEADWEVLPKDYVLYCVKFINPWHGNYLRRGEDAITKDGATTTVVRNSGHVEKDEQISLTTTSLHSVELPVTLVDANGSNVVCTLALTFDSDGKCVVSSETPGFTVSGTGSFVKNSENWGNKDRNAIYLEYTIEMTGVTYVTKDTFVVRDRGVAPETFSVSYSQI